LNVILLKNECLLNALILDMTSKPTNARGVSVLKYIYAYHTPPTCFGHSCGHLQEDSNTKGRYTEIL
jgi:hypothetical protein